MVFDVEGWPKATPCTTHIKTSTVHTYVFKLGGEPPGYFNP
jgi:hypothetical protein